MRLLITLVALLCAGLASLGDARPATLNRPVAVLDFDNHSGDARYDPLGKGLAAMMISDLSSVPAVTLLERQKLQELLRELEMQRSQYFDPATAQEVGRMVGAEYMVVGSIVALQPAIRIDTRVIEVATAEVVKTAQVEGKQDRLFDLQEKLAEELIDGLEIALSPEERERLRAQQEANRLDRLETALAFSEGLDLLDRDDVVGASEKLFQVVQEAPASTVVRLTYDEVKRRAVQRATDQAKDRLRGFLRGRIGGRDTSDARR